MRKRRERGVESVRWKLQRQRKTNVATLSLLNSAKHNFLKKGPLFTSPWKQPE